MTLRVGFLGHGFMGRAHANALARLPMFFPDAPPVERHVLIGRDEDTLAADAAQFGFSEVATDWRDALAAIDILYNLGPNDLHAEPSIAALERGIHVMCEKPLAHERGAADRMAEAARASDALAAVAFNYRFVPAIQLSKSMVDAGELGEIRHVHARYLQDWLADPDAPWSWRCDETIAGSGALGDLGSHSIDLARFLVGDLAHIHGQLRTFVTERPIAGGSGTRPVTVDDAFTAHATFEDGALGVFEGSRVARGHKNDHVIEIHGSRGSLRFSLERLNELELLAEEHRGYETILVTDESDPYVSAWWPPGHVLGWEHTFVHENYEFLTAIADDRPVHPDFEAGLAVQRALDAIEESHRTGERTSLP